MDLFCLYNMHKYDFKPLYQTVVPDGPTRRIVHVLIRDEKGIVELQYTICSHKEDYKNESRAKNMIRLV